MKYAINILNWIKGNVILSFVLIGCITFSATQIFKAKAKANCEDCTPFKQQNKELISALIDIKKDLQASITTSYQLQPELIMFASLDTTRPQQQQAQVRKVLNKIDSILYRVKQDSIKQKSKT